MTKTQMIDLPIKNILDKPYANSNESHMTKTGSFKKRSFLEVPLRRDMQMTMQKRFSKIPLKNSQLLRQSQTKQVVRADVSQGMMSKRTVEEKAKEE